MRKNEINELAGGTRSLCQGNCAPNHYSDRGKNNLLSTRQEHRPREICWTCHDGRVKTLLPNWSKAASTVCDY